VKREFKAGDWVEVRSAREIAETLDDDGTLEGLPFMHEMAAYCGGTYRVLRVAEKACVEYPGFSYKIRSFRGDDVLILKGLRCDGEQHDGCGRACVFFWKTAWLRRSTAESGSQKPAGSASVLDAKLRAKTSSGKYFCQSTELAKATEPLSRVDMIKKCVAEVRSGSRGVFEILRLMIEPLWRKATRWIPRRKLAGDLKRTPVEELGLQPGELVHIKSPEEIAQTLDALGRNRGLICDYGMCRYSGGTYRVRSRLERMIAEPTGEMRPMQATVILEGLNCLCWNVFGGCPRDDYMYWREIWLKRASGNKAPCDDGTAACSMESSASR
jgi:hypothetical protein